MVEDSGFGFFRNYKPMKEHMTSFMEFSTNSSDLLQELRCEGT